MEKASPAKEVINVDAVSENMVMMFLAIEELHKETKMAWGKLAIPLEQVITTNNATTTDLKRWDVMISCHEDGMDGRVCANRVEIKDLQAKVMLAILDTLAKC